jgi:hypothetical protein
LNQGTVQSVIAKPPATRAALYPSLSASTALDA